MYKNLLRKKGLQSVRDEFTANNLRRMGVRNVVNTGCPTMWGLSPDHLSRVPAKKSGAVIFTLTDYKRDRSADMDMISVLAREYDRVLFWPQGSRDTDYFASLGVTCKVDILEDGLGAFDRALGAEVDFVGTRLHAGIRALQRSRRAIIVSIDNRAEEMRRDLNITIVRRGDTAGLVDKIRGTWVPEVVLPQQNIDDWIGQFATGSR